MSAFVKATRKKAKLRLALTGPSGSGKTRAALLMAKGLGGRIAVIDTERGSASLYCDLVDFDVMELGPPYSPERYIDAIRAAEAAGYDTLIIDSATHEWNGTGGCLELNDKIAEKLRGNTYMAWGQVTPRHRAFIDAMLHSTMHIIVTTRSKTDTAQIEENGRKKVQKLGMKTEQREGWEYEFTVVLDLTHDNHYAVASKDRTRLFPDPQQIDEGTGQRLRDWLDHGEETHESPVSVDEALFRAINTAKTMEELRHAYATAFRSTQLPSVMALYTDAKDRRKAELETLAAAEVDETAYIPD